MTDDETPQGPDVHELTSAEIGQRLSSERFGRLALATSREPDIFPLNYAVIPQGLLFATSQGNKLVEMAINENAAFEIDAASEQAGWSIVLRGRVRVLETEAEIAAAEQHAPTSWVFPDRDVYVLFSIDSSRGVTYRA